MYAVGTLCVVGFFCFDHPPPLRFLLRATSREYGHTTSLGQASFPRLPAPDNPLALLRSPPQPQQAWARSSSSGTSCPRTVTDCSTLAPAPTPRTPSSGWDPCSRTSTCSPTRPRTEQSGAVMLTSSRGWRGRSTTWLFRFRGPRPVARRKGQRP